MPVKTTTSTRIVTKTYRKPFEIRGNIDAKVNGGSFGDGNIATESLGQTVFVDANLYTRADEHDIIMDGQRCAMMRIDYRVIEDNYREKGYEKSSDSLWIAKSLYFPLEDGDYEEKDSDGKVIRSTRSREYVLIEKDTNRFYAVRHFRGKNQNYIPYSSGNRNGIPDNLSNWLTRDSLRPDQLQDWLPISDLQVKIDGQGSELTGQGNMAIKGYVEFTIERTDEITEYTYYTESMMGNEKKVEKFHPSVDTVLGRGYDICGRYAKRPNKDKVIDYEKLNEYKRIQQALGIRVSESESYSGESIREYTSHRENSLKVKVGAHAFGASFSKEMESSFSKDSEKKTGHRFATLKQVTQRETYLVQGYDNPNVMMDFLTPMFLKDLNTQTADYIIKHYGTHVVLGMVVGATLLLNMDYQQSLIKQSEATTYSDKTALKFDDGGNLIKPKLTESAESATEKMFNAIIKNLDEGGNAKDLNDLLKALTEYLSKVPNKNSSNIEGSYEEDYSENIKNSLVEEDKSEHIRCFVTGGNDALALAINNNNDLSRIEAWSKTVDENTDFCDFIPETLIPIEDLVPNGFKLTPSEIRAASSRYQNEHSKKEAANYKKGVITIDFDTMQSGTTTPIDCIGFIETKDKPVSWKLNIELMNFDDGKCGFGISLLVSGEMPDGWKPREKTTILNSYTHVIDPVEIGDLSVIEIDTDHPDLANKADKTSFGAVGNWNRELVDWASAAQEVKRGSAYRVIDMNSPIEVHLDDPYPNRNPLEIQINSLFDLKNIGVRGRLKIPWIGY